MLYGTRFRRSLGKLGSASFVIFEIRQPLGVLRSPLQGQTSTDPGDRHVPGGGSAQSLGLVHFCGLRPPRAIVDALQGFEA